MKDIEVGYKEDVNYLIYDVFDLKLHTVPFQSLSQSEVNMEGSAGYKDAIIRAILTYRDQSYSKCKVLMHYM